MTEQRRRIDRILADDYLDDLDTRSSQQLRELRAECEEEESGISYARRVVQGKLDIIRAEALRRREAREAAEETGGEQGDEGTRTLLDILPGILGDDVSGQPLRQRVSKFLVPPAVRYHRREIDRIADEATLAQLSDKSTDELTALVEEISDKEQELSALRRRLLDRVDAIQEELARRYKQGEANVGEVLRS